jgi:3-methyl-2-oxobutanoate hydroxymethyltransferase
VSTFRDLKAAGRRIAMITAYDFHSARLAEKAGVDAILVGDSMGMTVLGYDSTLPVTVDDIASHTAAVARACSRVMVIADMPFLSYQVSVEDALRNCGRMLAQAGAQAVKLEGASERALATVAALVEAGIPVMGHLGLTPQSVHALGGYRTQGREAPAAARLMHDALALQAAGCFAVVLECVPAELAARVSELLEIPTIGIGAGPGCDGEVQVFHDLLGYTERVPKHAKRYADLEGEIERAVAEYAQDVRDGEFPGEEQTTHATPELLAQAQLLFAGDLEEGTRE